MQKPPQWAVQVRRLALWELEVWSPGDHSCALGTTGREIGIPGATGGKMNVPAFPPYGDKQRDQCQGYLW